MDDLGLDAALKNEKHFAYAMMEAQKIKKESLKHKDDFGPNLQIVKKMEVNSVEFTCQKCGSYIVMESNLPIKQVKCLSCGAVYKK